METAARDFWRWFLEEDASRHAIVVRWYSQHDDPDATDAVRRALEEVNDALQSVHPALAINFGPPAGEGRHELVVTVEGRREGMEAANLIVATSPELPRWQLIQYKPPIGGEELSVTYNGVPLDARAIECAAEMVDGEIIVILFLPGLGGDRDDDIKGAALVLLDGIIGEWRGLSKIDVLQCAASTHTLPPTIARFPLAALAERLDTLRPEN